MKVVIDKDSDYAPCCYLICKVDDKGNWDTRDEKTTILSQTDFDLPGLASNLGFIPCDKCGDTDGTINCTHKTVITMIIEATKYLNNHLGQEFDDPGYFN